VAVEWKRERQHQCLQKHVQETANKLICYYSLSERNWQLGINTRKAKFSRFS
jgi:hypothetical protein